MFYPALEDLMKRTGIKTHYLLTMIVAKRARMIGSDPAKKIDKR